MKLRHVLLALPLLTACEDAPTLVSGASFRADASPFSYDAPITAEGFVAGADGVQLHYRIVGTGPDSVVVLSGGPGLTYRYLAADFAPLAHGRTLIFYDQRGAGRSTLIADPAQLTPDRHVADLEALRQHFGLETLQLVGHSWGAMLAGFYAAAHPERVERIVMVTSGPATKEYDNQFVAERTARTSPADAALQGQLIGLLLSGQDPNPVQSCEQLLLSLFRAYFADPANLDNRHAPLCDVPPAAAQTFLFTNAVGMAALGPNFDLRPMFAGIQAPTLVIHGAADAIPLASSQDFADALPNGELRVIEGAGHFPWLEQPVEFFTSVNTFLRRRNIAH